MPTDTPTITPIPDGQVTGRIYIPSLDRPFLTTVYLQDTSTKETTNVATDSDGYYSFTDVRPGNYVLAIDKIRISPEDPLFSYCKLLVDKATWEYSLDLDIVGGKLQPTAIQYSSLAFDMAGDAIESDLLLVCE